MTWTRFLRYFFCKGNMVTGGFLKKATVMPSFDVLIHSAWSNCQTSSRVAGAFRRHEGGAALHRRSCNCQWPRINTLRPNNAYVRQYNIPTLVQIMVCHLFGAIHLLSEPMLPYFQPDHQDHIIVEFYLKLKSFRSRKFTWKCRLHYNGHIALMCPCVHN